MLFSPRIGLLIYSMNTVSELQMAVYLLYQSCLQSQINSILNFLCYFHSCFFLFINIFLIYSVFVYKSYITVSCYSFLDLYHCYFLRLLFKFLLFSFPLSLFLRLILSVIVIYCYFQRTYINFLLSEIQLPEWNTKETASHIKASKDKLC
jgi:hypothetical protein